LRSIEADGLKNIMGYGINALFKKEAILGEILCFYLIFQMIGVRQEILHSVISSDILDIVSCFLGNL
jgi:hypothetical protein